MPDGSFIEPMTIQSKTSSPPDVHLVFPAREIAVRRALQSTCQALKALGTEAAALGIVEIVLAEVTNNIVEHAYSAQSSGTITLSCIKRTTNIRFEVIDQGNMLPGGEIPSKQEHDLTIDLDNLPEGSFGWGLIRDMTMNLAYRRCEGQNILRFSISLTEL